MKSPAIFIDRDGTLIREKHYLHKPEDVEFFPGALSALSNAANAGFKIIMVTNQSGVGRGYFTLDDVDQVHAHISREMAAENCSFVKIYVAPEAPDQPSRGRKPSPEFLFDAREEFDIDLERSYIVGDKLIDLECGWNAGLRKSILTRTGYGKKVEEAKPESLSRAVVVDNLAKAIDWILADAAPLQKHA